MPGGGEVSTVQPQAMSGDDTPMPAAMENYGVQAVQAIISSVAGVPANKRAAAMKTASDKLDASLWTRTQAIFSRYVSQGMAPAQAFPAALARAMSTGMTAELIKKGFKAACICLALRARALHVHGSTWAGSGGWRGVEG